MMQMVMEHDCLRVLGVVNVHTLTRQHFKQFVRYCQQPELHTIDLVGVERADSACVSLLLTAIRENVSGSLKCVNLPNSLRLLGDLYELSHLEEWKQLLNPTHFNSH